MLREPSLRVLNKQPRKGLHFMDHLLHRGPGTDFALRTQSHVIITNPRERSSSGFTLFYKLENGIPGERNQSSSP